jgi:hypothetical protein
MPRIAQSFDPKVVEWRHFADPACKEFKIDFEYSLLGYDLEANRLDMLLRYAPGWGHCRRHRHVASTVTMVLDGEQHLTELLPDGTRKQIVRRKGEYALAVPDALPHLESGGATGGTVILSMTTGPGGVLFEYLDENLENGTCLTIAEFVEAWKTGVAYGAQPGQTKAAAAE